MRHPLVNSGVVQARFVISDERDPPDARHDDFIRLPVAEDYHQLTAKVIAFMQWFKNNSNASYVMKLDDDSYPHLDLLLPHLQRIKNPLAYVGGGMSPHAPVRRYGKWAEYNFPEDFYPPYMQGAAYMLSNELVKAITVPEFTEILLANENTTVGVRVDMENQRLKRLGQEVAYHKIPGTLYGCRMNNTLSMNWDARMFPCVFKKEMQQYPGPVVGQCCGPLKRGHWSETKNKIQADEW